MSLPPKLLYWLQAFGMSRPGAIAAGWRMTPNRQVVLYLKNCVWLDMWDLNTEGLQTLWLKVSATLEGGGGSFWLNASVFVVIGIWLTPEKITENASHVSGLILDTDLKYVNYNSIFALIINFLRRLHSIHYPITFKSCIVNIYGGAFIQRSTPGISSKEEI
jgi:hypothetical protein